MNPSNREFRRTAAKDIFSDAEGNSVFNAKGELSPIGALRIRNAIFAKAYKDDYLLTQLSEATDNNSKNIMNATVVARASEIKIIGLTGADGGELATVSDVAIKVPETETYMIQELHLPVYHCLCLMLEDKFFGESR